MSAILKPQVKSLAGYVSKNVYDGKRVLSRAEADYARRAVDANRDARAAMDRAADGIALS